MFDDAPTIEAVTRRVRDEVSSATLEMVPVPGRDDEFLVRPSNGRIEVSLTSDLFPVAGTEELYTDGIVEALRTMGPISTIRFSRDNDDLRVIIVFDTDAAIAASGEYALFRRDLIPV